MKVENAHAVCEFGGEMNQNQLAARLTVDDRRALLLDAALRVIARVGIAALTTRAITEEAGMRQGVFHYCFRDKNEMLAELIALTVSRLIEDSSVVNVVKGDFSATVRFTLRALWTKISATPTSHLALYELTLHAMRDPELAALAQRQYEGYLAAASRLLGTLAQEAGIRWLVPTDTLARTLVTVIDGLGLNWLADRDAQATLAVLDAFSCQLAALVEPAPSVLS